MITSHFSSLQSFHHKLSCRNLSHSHSFLEMSFLPIFYSVLQVFHWHSFISFVFLYHCIYLSLSFFLFLSPLSFFCLLAFERSSILVSCFILSHSQYVCSPIFFRSKLTANIKIRWNVKKKHWSQFITMKAQGKIFTDPFANTQKFC